ncbi:MAG: methylmalonyl-CoA mutase [Hyphomicrobiales bacterium]|nr:MAG: methylmalonyl-CoA mutase [Hyphomicrobiales bacterium]
MASISLLSDDFAGANETTWLAAVEKALKGAAFDKLRSKTDDGLAIEPLYPQAANAVAEPGRADAAPWAALQRADHPDAKAANAIALDDLAGGAAGLDIVGRGAPNAFGFGIDGLTDAATFVTLLDDVLLDAIRIRLNAGADGVAAAAALAAHIKASGTAPASVSVSFGIDPLGAQAASGTADADAVAKAAAAAVALKANGFAGPFLAADGRPFHAAGASEAQEIAAVLAAAVGYLRALEATGMALEDAVAAIEAVVSVDAEQFLGIAKIRALRRLWRQVCEACGVAPTTLTVHTETAWRMMTRRDPWVNMLRTTIAGFAAGVGGATSLTVLPFTAALGLADGFARRVARNTQSVLLEESNLYRVADPAAGSGYVETMTDQLAQAAWALFQEIEAAGGLSAALASGDLQEKITTVRAARDRDIAKRKVAITGTSEFPNIHEAPVKALEVTAFDAPVSGDGALAPIRLGAVYEALRDQADAFLAETGKRPAVFLATLGRIADFTARATFAKNFFEAAGIEAIIGEGAADADTAAKAFADSGARICCLCSSDAVYADLAETAAKAVKDAGAAHISLAGRPGDLEAALKAAGVDGFLYVGCNVLDFLTEVQAIALQR